MPDRPLTPHELHQKAISLLDQLERVAEAWRRGRTPTAEEVDRITTGVTALRARVEDTARLQEAGAPTLAHVSGARRRVGEALALVDELRRERSGHVPTTPRSPGGRRRADGD